MFLRRSLHTVVLFAVLTYSVFLPAKSKHIAGSPEVKLTSRTELVLVPTLVTSRSGAHVGGLTKGDFTILEDGVAQQIATFEEITSQARIVARPSNPNEFTNMVAGGRGTARVTLILLDFINTRFADQRSARMGLLNYLVKSTDCREPMALYTLNRSGIHVIHDFATDPRILVAALEKVTGDTFYATEKQAEAVTRPVRSEVLEPAAVQREAQVIRTMLESKEPSLNSFEQRLAITITLDAIQQLAQAMAGFPGRKSLIWVTGGFPFSLNGGPIEIAPAGRDSLVDILPLYERAWQRLNDAQVALYPIDAAGLRCVYCWKQMTKQMDVESTLEAFAAMTGGRAYLDSNDLAKGIAEAVQDSSQYYMLGYYLNQSAEKPGWRRLAVKVDREHTQVRARSGFFVTSPPPDADALRKNNIALALASPLDFTSLALAVQWMNVDSGRMPGKKQVHYRIHVAPDPALIDDADRNHLALQFTAWAKTLDGKEVVSPVVANTNGHLSDKSVAEVRYRGIDFSSILDLAPGDYTVRFVVHDNLSGRIGAVTAPLQVP